MGKPVSRRSFLGLVGVGTLAACSSAPAKTGLPPIASGSASASPSASATAKPTLDALSKTLSRPLLTPGSGDFTTVAELYNPKFGTTPQAVAQCTTADDVAACVRFAAASGLPFALRSGGHSYGGWSSSTGLVVDVRGLKSVDVSGDTVRIGAGALLGDVYTAVASKGRAIAAGSCPTVGITGLTLGGGVGVLARALGLTCDALQSVDLVTADGNARTVSASQDADLFWALQGGGGGSFGAVTALTLKTSVVPAVSTFFYRWDLTHGEEVLTAWQPWMAKADNRLWSTLKLLADPGPGTQTVTVSGTWIGPKSGLSAQTAPLLQAVSAAPASQQLLTSSYLDTMLMEAGCDGKSAADCETAAYTPAERLPFAATSAYVTSPLPPAGVEAAVAVARKAADLPGLYEGGLAFDALGGQVAARAVGDSAFAYRKALADVQFSATWSGSRPAAPFEAFVQSARKSLQQWTGDTAYVNYADAQLTDYTAAYWGPNYARLQSVKRTYDAHELFTFPQAVRA